MLMDIGFKLFKSLLIGYFHGSFAQIQFLPFLPFLPWAESICIGRTWVITMVFTVMGRNLPTLLLSLLIYVVQINTLVHASVLMKGRLRGLAVACWTTDHYHLCSNPGVGISEGCFVFHFVSLPLEGARPIQPALCTKVAVKHQSSSSVLMKHRPIIIIHIFVITLICLDASSRKTALAILVPQFPDKLLPPRHFISSMSKMFVKGNC